MILTPTQIAKNINWLLKNGSAPAKYLTHRDLLATTTSRKAMHSLWSEVENSSCVCEIFDKQEANGAGRIHWRMVGMTSTGGSGLGR